VAEEDPGVQGTVVTLLGELGYDIVTANDGKTALNLIKEGLRPDLRFTDVVMPRPTPSTELARQAKEIILGLPVLFTSGDTHNALIRGGRLDKGVQLLSKPCRQEDLAAKIRACLDEACAPLV
jgi:CheY-like chemotaxis protein